MSESPLRVFRGPWLQTLQALKKSGHSVIRALSLPPALVPTRIVLLEITPIHSPFAALAQRIGLRQTRRKNPSGQKDCGEFARIGVRSNQRKATI